MGGQVFQGIFEDRLNVWRDVEDSGRLDDIVLIAKSWKRVLYG